jgi:hypothetical protein
MSEFDFMSQDNNTATDFHEPAKDEAAAAGTPGSYHLNA